MPLREKLKKNNNEEEGLVFVYSGRLEILKIKKTTAAQLQETFF